MHCRGSYTRSHPLVSPAWDHIICHSYHPDLVGYLRAVTWCPLDHIGDHILTHIHIPVIVSHT